MLPNDGYEHSLFDPNKVKPFNSDVWYSDKDQNGHPVPPKGTSPEDAGLYETGQPNMYKTHDAKHYFRRNEDGSYTEVGKDEATKPPPPPEQPPPAPASEQPQPASGVPPGEDPAIAAATPASSKVPYSSKDVNGELVPPTGTVPEDAGLTWKQGHNDMTLYETDDGVKYILNTDTGEYTKAPPGFDPKQAGPWPGEPADSAPAPGGAPQPAPEGSPGSKVPYSSKDANDQAVPPPGTPPEDAGLVLKYEFTSGAQMYVNPITGKEYKRETDGSYVYQPKP